MKKLHIGLQTFADLITDNFVYVDKTEILYHLVKDKSRYFLSRPRRFGKSLTCSTLDAIFCGHKKLFDGLAISKTDYQWPVRPVVRFDFEQIDHDTPERLEQALNNAMVQVATKAGLVLSNQLLKEKFAELIVKLAAQGGPVAVIIDEYDKPILDHLANKAKADTMREILRNFYGTLKSKDVDSNLHFVFITGVSKFSKVALFSELNNLDDLTYTKRATTLCGYTQAELELVFDEHIDALATEQNKTKQQMLDELKRWYNGYQLTMGGETVYNPFSILNCFKNNTFSNYWFTSGTPNFLIQALAHNSRAAEELIQINTWQIAASDLDAFSAETYYKKLNTLFVQTGYLTFAGYNPISKIYSLKYPNDEVRESMTENIFDFVLHIDKVKWGNMIERFRIALGKGDIDAFCGHMYDFFKLIPHTIVIKHEHYFHGIFFSVATAVGARIEAEYGTYRGFIDAVIETNDHVFVIEFKYDKTPDAALAQIEERDYLAKFKIEGSRPITLVGMNFDWTDPAYAESSGAAGSGITMDWKIKPVKS